MITVKKIKAIETYKIRLEMLRKNIPLPYEFKGDNDKETFHLGAFEKDKLIAVSSYMKVKNKNFNGEQYQLRGMATLTECQGVGAGRLMLQKAFSILKNMKIDCLWCNARIIAIDFYKKYGFKTYGKQFEIKPVGNHYVMYKNLKDVQ